MDIKSNKRVLGGRTSANRAGDPNCWAVIVMGCGTGDEGGDVIDAIVR